MSVYVSFIVIVKICEQLKSLLTGKWMNKLWYIHVIEWPSTIEVNQLLTHTTKWINQNSKRGQTKNIMYKIPLIQILENANLSTIAKRESVFCLGVVQGWDGGNASKRLQRDTEKLLG